MEIVEDVKSWAWKCEDCNSTYLKSNALGIQYHLHNIESVKSWAWKWKFCITMHFRSLDKMLYYGQFQDELSY